MISREEWTSFLEAYTWQLLKSPDYRLGQAFLNYYIEINRTLKNDGYLGQQLATQLYNKTDPIQARAIIGQWIEP
jgi:hypothetical protein